MTNAVVLVPSLVQGGPVLFVVLWLGVIGWLASNFLVRSAHALAVTNRTLFWTNYLGTVEVDMRDVVGIRVGLGGAIGIIDCRDGRKLRVPIMQGYQPLIEEVGRHFPQLEIEAVGTRDSSMGSSYSGRSERRTPIYRRSMRVGQADPGGHPSWVVAATR